MCFRPFAWSWDTLLFFRFIGGLVIGGSSVLGPMYTAELAPARLRGRLVGVFQINIVIGALLAYFSNYVLGTFHLGLNEWRWQLGISAIPPLGFLSMLFGIPPAHVGW
jgi:SP family arabinose:H+ symporter-like MFS transporter